MAAVSWCNPFPQSCRAAAMAAAALPSQMWGFVAGPEPTDAGSPQPRCLATCPAGARHFVAKQLQDCAQWQHVMTSSGLASHGDDSQGMQHLSRRMLQVAALQGPGTPEACQHQHLRRHRHARVTPLAERHETHGLQELAGLVCMMIVPEAAPPLTGLYPAWPGPA